ncbi:hypothetical protein [Halobaculum limi]|uniref:hypothetical protein n=1 Tax=Halobaculum limi TaxID=3031916 RepID=UPI002405D80A|nr:hypothetical protein [Halobaculum sp. YSMS11]
MIDRTDPETDAAVVRSRQRRDNDALGRFIEDVFDSFVEHGVLAFPSLLLSVMFVPRDATLPLVGGYTAFVLGLATVRDDRLHARYDAFPAWPRGLANRPLLRAVYYNVVVLVVAAYALAAAVLPTDVAGTLSVVSIAFGAVAGVAFPAVFRLVPRVGSDPPARRRRDVFALRADRRRRNR